MVGCVIYLSASLPFHMALSLFPHEKSKGLKLQSPNLVPVCLVKENSDAKPGQVELAQVFSGKST